LVCGDLRLVNPREYEAYRVEGIAHQTQDVLARVQTFHGVEDGSPMPFTLVGFTARGRTAKRNLQRPRDAAAEIVGWARAVRWRCCSAGKDKDYRTRRSIAVIGS